VTSSETQIANLLYRYAECIDEGRLSDAADMFAAAEVLRRDGGGVQVLSSADLLEFWRRKIILHVDGTPRTKHVVTNPIIDVDEAAGTAECRSTYVVLQQVGGSALQPVIAGRYHDRFTRSGGQWAFSFRDYSLRDLVGDLSSHVRGG
jgi:3-phenylpropionate/cinnamic acid dioxygenase small subunit